MPTVTKLDPIELLSKLADSKSSGCLELDTELVSWKIYLQQGHLQYVYCSVQLVEQLKYYLHLGGCKQAIVALNHLPPSFSKIELKTQAGFSAQDLYGKVIAWLLEEKHLDLDRGLKLINNIARDELNSCLWLERGSHSWQPGNLLPAWIPSQIESSLSLDVAKCIKNGQQKLAKWRNCSTELVSIYQRPYFPPSWETKPLPTPGSLNHKTLIELTKVLRGRTSIRQLSILLNKDELQVAQVLSPYIDEKIIYLHHAQTPLDKLPNIPRNIEEAQIFAVRDERDGAVNQNSSSSAPVKTYKIVCIDDSPTILSEIQRFLDGQSFEITAIDDPVQAVSQIFKINPDLILLDITMPRINGYKLCGLLRSSGNCNNVPIIMVSGNTGLIDKARAKLAGATDYFTKPFTKEGLNKIVAMYLPQS